MSTMAAYHHHEYAHRPLVQQRMVVVEDLSCQEPQQGLIFIHSDSEDDDDYDDHDPAAATAPLPEHLVPTHLETIQEGSMIEDETSSRYSVRTRQDSVADVVDINPYLHDFTDDDHSTDDDPLSTPSMSEPLDADKRSLQGSVVGADQERMNGGAHEEKTSADNVEDDTIEFWRVSSILQKPHEAVHEQPHTPEQSKPPTIWSIDNCDDEKAAIVRKRVSKEEIPKELTVQTSVAALSSTASLCSRCSSISAELMPHSATSTHSDAPRLARPASVMSFIPPRPTSMYINTTTTATAHQQQPIVPLPTTVQKSRSTPDLLVPMPCTKSKLSLASFSLTHSKDTLKTYHRMARKTSDPKIKMAYVHYLLQVAKLYDNQRNNATRERLLEEAGFWVERLAKQGHAEALFLKGKWHWRPELEECAESYRLKPQPHKAYKCFQQAARGDCVDALYELARYQKAYGEYNRAVKCYEKAALKGHTLATYKMAKILLRGQLQQKRNITRGLEFLKKAADANDPKSAEPAYVLSCVYADELERIGIDRDSQMSRKNERLALQYLQKATQAGLPMALHHMGQVHEFGLLGQQPDPWQGYACYNRAAEDGDERAMLDLSRLYAQGISGYLMPQHEIAFKWCQRAASKGLEKAEYILGTYYEDGVGTLPDYPRALECFGKAASKGYAPAAEKLNLPKCVQPSTNEEEQQLSRLSSLRRKATFELVHQVEHPQLKNGPIQGNCSIM